MKALGHVALWGLAGCASLTGEDNVDAWQSAYIDCSQGIRHDAVWDPASEGERVSLADELHDCDVGAGYELDGWRSLDRGGLAITMVGIYETDAPHQEAGAFSLTIEGGGPTLLILHAHEPVDWVIDEVVPGTVEEIIVAGYDEQTVSGVSVPVSSWDPPLTLTDIWASDDGCDLAADGDCIDECLKEADRDKFMAALVADLGLSLTHFYGCYRMTELTVPEP